MNDEIRIVYFEAVCMPNGELISEGKTIGWTDKVKCVAEVIQVNEDSVLITKLNRKH